MGEAYLPNLLNLFLFRNFQSMDNTYFLSQEQKKFYHENGYLIIKKLYDINTLEVFRQRFVDYCNGKVKQSAQILKEPTLVKHKQNPEDYINKIQEITHDEVFMKYSEDPRLLHIVSQLIGRGLTLMNSMVINKPPGSSIHPPHQDMYYFPVRPFEAAATWTAIDDATYDNGCLWCVPGSHNDGLHEHELGQGGKKFYHLIKDEAKYAPEHKRFYVEMGSGDTIFLHSLLVHGSGPNNTKKHRKSISCHYINNRCEYIPLEGTVQEPLLRDFKVLVQRNGFPKSYQDHWKMRTKMVQKTSSHL